MTGGIRVVLPSWPSAIEVGENRGWLLNRSFAGITASIRKSAISAENSCSASGPTDPPII